MYHKILIIIPQKSSPTHFRFPLQNKLLVGEERASER